MVGFPIFVIRRRAWKAARLPAAPPLVKKFTRLHLRARAGVRMLGFTVRSMPASVLFSTLILGFAACGPRVTNRNIDALNAQFDSAEKNGKGLSVKEVEAILGQPTKQETYQIEQQTVREMPMVRYYYVENGQTVALHFIDNKLQNRVVHFGAKPSEDAPLRMPPKPEPAK